MELNSAILERNRMHLRQAKHTPFAQSDRSNLLNDNDVNNFSDKVLAGQWKGNKE